MIEVVPYSAELQSEWNTFVQRSRNGTFLFDRAYMDYHADRFVDQSVVLRDGKQRMVAIMPASRSGEEVISHGGLTYGGLVLGEETSTREVLASLESVFTHYRRVEARAFTYKCIPGIYHRWPSEEDRFALHRLGAKLVRRDLSSAAVPAGRKGTQTRRRRGVQKARTAGIAVTRSRHFASFWSILEANLSARHGVRPVHTLPEIESLVAAFPEQIKLYTAGMSDETVAGTVIYETPYVAHAQYIASAPAGRDSGALDLLFETLITEIYREKRYFDFGISTEDGGRALNEGLLDYKEGHGATGIVHDFYRVEF